MPEMRGSDNGLLMGPYRQQPLSETSDTKFSSRHTNNNGGGKLVLSQYNIGGGGGSGSYHQPANDQSEEQDYANDEFEGDHHYDSLEQHSKDQSFRGSAGRKLGKGKRSATTKETKILQTMKAYLPQLVPKKLKAKA